MQTDGDVAIVGSGLAALTAYATLRDAGLPPGAIAVFGPDDDPAAPWRRRAESIRQRRMRSESDGHLWPASFPGLAVRDAVASRSPVPLLRTLTDTYRPSVEAFLAHVAEVRERTRWDESVHRAQVGEVRPETGGFALDGYGRFRHILLALGHPGLAVPPELERDPRAVHAYEPHEYAARVTVVGAGMAAATEWLNALAAGAEVTSVRRRAPLRRPLNLPRHYFSKRGLAGFRALPPGRRAEALAGFSAPSYPPGRAWDDPIMLAEHAGRFRLAPTPNGTEQIICATGFKRGYRHHPLLVRLVEEHGAPAYEQWLALGDDFALPGLSDSSRTLAVSGVAAQWAYPAADTLVGMKAAARAFRRRAVPSPTR